MGTTAEKLAYLADTKTAIKDAIIAKGVEVPEVTTFREYADKISQIIDQSSKPDADISKPIKFYDYDGSLVESWDLEELASSESLPSPASHNGLTFQEWNYTLEQLKTVSKADVGALYMPSDEKTHIFIELLPSFNPINNLPRVKVRLNFTQSIAYGVTINWGDGGNDETAPDVGQVSLRHTYENAGNYTITLLPQDECEMTLGDSSSDSVMGGFAPYDSMAKEIWVGKNVTTITNSSFRSLYHLKKISLHKDIVSMDDNCFRTTYSLSYVTIPPKITTIPNSFLQDNRNIQNVSIPLSVVTIGKNAFENNGSLKNIYLNPGITEIPTRAFDGCYSLFTLVIPSSVTSIGAYAFQNCISLRWFIFESETPPILENNTAFELITDGRIYVPESAVNSYKAAPIWNEFADSIYGY